MKCPHCLVEFHAALEQSQLGNDCEAHWQLLKQICPACKRFVIQLFRTERHPSNKTSLWNVWPKAPSRTPLSNDVPQDFAADYSEACLVLQDSPKASAALSRRCLQHTLREKAGVKHGELANEIQQVIDSGKLPSHLSESLDAIRNIGNFAAHPIKSKSTGEIVDVELGEAEWNLDVLESIFDFYFVQPELLKRKKAALDKKLADAGKPPMK
jgi:hypothetical protein